MNLKGPVTAKPIGYAGPNHIGRLFVGTISRSHYWRFLVLSGAYLFLLAMITYGIRNFILSQSRLGQSMTETVDALLLTLFAVLLGIWLVWYVSIVVRRARDAGSVVPWTLIAFLSPLGFITVGLARSYHKK